MTWGDRQTDRQNCQPSAMDDSRMDTQTDRRRDTQTDRRTHRH